MINKLKNVIRIVVNKIRFFCFAIMGVKIQAEGICTSRISTEFSFSKGSNVIIGVHFTSLQNSRILVRGGKLRIGDYVGVNSNCVIACHEEINIGNNVGIGPNVCIYDHDHDFRAEGGKGAKNYRCSAVIIEDNVWIGANTVILRGTHIGANSVIAAGCVVTGNIPANSILMQKRDNTLMSI